MDTGFLDKVKKCVKVYKEDVPNVYKRIVNIEVKECEAILEALVLGLKEEESKIKEERQRPFVTDNYENGVRQFTNALCMVLVSEYSIVKKSTVCEMLLQQKHMGYSFYHNDYCKKIVWPNDFEQRHERAAYLGLINFYESFYGCFADNEEAIALMCNYFFCGELTDEEQDVLVNALLSHVMNAGTINNFGYAFHGIEMIEKYINNLPNHIISAIVNQYELFRVINNDVNRHQVYSLINASNMIEEQKKKMKFWCIDSLWIANCINRSYVIFKQEKNEKIDLLYSLFDIKVGDDTFPVTAEPAGYWQKGEMDSREFVFDEEILFKILLQEDKVVVWSTVQGVQPLLLSYQYSDWQMENEYRQKIIAWFCHLSDTTAKNRGMKFSFLYLDNYRELSNQVLDFDHKTKYDMEKKQISKNESVDISVPFFYGKNVYSLSCIVGKNGTGKTSMVDFLRNPFFRLLSLIQNNEVGCAKGCIDQVTCEISGVIEKGIQFVVVFSLGDKLYYLTNMKDVEITGITPYSNDLYLDYKDMSKIVYFSSMLKANQKELFVDTEPTIEGDERIRRLKKIILQAFPQIDFSETRSFLSKRRAIEKKRNIEKEKEMLTIGESNSNRDYANNEFCYQMVLLSQLTEEKIKKYIDYCDNKEFILSSEFGTETERVALKEMRDSGCRVKEIIDKFKDSPDVQVDNFSSGEYAKFSFLAKLFWLLNGSEKTQEIIGYLLDKYEFDMNEVLHKDETALIFIDEGELYYHPEWQREYVSTLLDFINSVEDIKVQIVLTTNSPFILSDVLNEDVVYLSKDNYNKIFRQLTLAKNIHQLLTDDFFMSSTIGEYARQYIQDIQMLLDEETKSDIEKEALSGDIDKKKKEDQKRKLCLKYFRKDTCTLEDIWGMIKVIGEPVYRHGLEKMLKRSSYYKKEMLLELEREKILLEEKIARLKEGVPNDTN